MRLYNVKYITSYWPFSPAANLTALGTYGGAYLYQNDDTLPRAYLVGKVQSATDRDDALKILASDAFDPARSVLLEGGLPGFAQGENDSGSVEFLRYATNEAVMQVRALQDAILVFSDSYFPGWVAEIDGRETPIYRANVTQRAVVLPAGEHRVSFRFKPRTVVVGLWVSLSSLVVLVGGLLLPRRGKEASPGATAHDKPGASRF